VPFGPYVVDFICIEAKLIVEADGGQHAEEADADRVRTQYFESVGYRVLRFWNNDVLQNLDGVLETIACGLAIKTPSPQPSPQGESESAAARNIVPSPPGEKDRMRGSLV
jgi:very-short-patch-repair endonuclease